MATVDSNFFEIQRRGYQWNKDSTLDDLVTSLLWDTDPNTAVAGATPGQTKLVAMPIGSQFMESSGILWCKTVMPNTWVDITSQDTGKVQILDWVQYTAYEKDDMLIDPETRHLYRATRDYSSDEDIISDIMGGALEFIGDGECVLIYENVDEILPIGNGVCWNIQAQSYVIPENKTQIAGIKVSNYSVLISGKLWVPTWNLLPHTQYFFKDDGSLTVDRTSVYAGETHNNSEFFILHIKMSDGASVGPMSQQGQLYIEIAENAPALNVDFAGGGSLTTHIAGSYAHFMFGTCARSDPNALVIQQMDSGMAVTSTYMLTDDTADLQFGAACDDGTYVYIGCSKISIPGTYSIIKWDPIGHVIVAVNDFNFDSGRSATLTGITYSNSRFFACGDITDGSAFALEFDENLVQLNCGVFQNTEARDILCYVSSAQSWVAIAGRHSSGRAKVVVCPVDTLVATNSIEIGVAVGIIHSICVSGGQLICAGRYNSNAMAVVVGGTGSGLVGNIYVDSGHTGAFYKIQIASGMWLATGEADGRATYAYVFIGGGVSTATIYFGLVCNSGTTRLFGYTTNSHWMFGTAINGPVNSANTIFRMRVQSLGWTGTLSDANNNYVATWGQRNLTSIGNPAGIVSAPAGSAGGGYSPGNMGTGLQPTSFLLSSIKDAINVAFRESITYVGLTAPTVDHDSLDGAGIKRFFDVGDIYSHGSNKYICVDNTAGSAVWDPISGEAIVSFLNLTDVPPQLPVGDVNRVAKWDGTSWVIAQGVELRDSSLFANVYEKCLLRTTLNSTQAVDWNEGGLQHITLAHSPVTLTFIPPSGGQKSLRLILAQDASGNRDIILPSIFFEDNIPPILNKAPNSVTVIDLYYDGTSYKSTNSTRIGKESKNTFYNVATNPSSGLVKTSVSGGGGDAAQPQIGVPSNKLHNGIVEVYGGIGSNGGVSYATQGTVKTHLCTGGDIFICDFSPVVSGATIRMGFHDCNSVTDAVNGIYIEVTPSGVVQGKTASNNIRSTTSGYTLPVNKWYRGIIVVRYDYAKVDFYIQDDAGVTVWAASLSTNMPPRTLGRETNIGVIATIASGGYITIMYADVIKFGNQVNF
jgi:hypothetical protein